MFIASVALPPSDGSARGLPAFPSGLAMLALVCERQEAGMMRFEGAIALIQALILQHSGRLLVLTEGVQPGAVGVRSPLDGGFWGLARSARSVIPEVSLSCIDGDGRRSSNGWCAGLTMLNSDLFDHHPEWAMRAGAGRIPRQGDGGLGALPGCCSSELPGAGRQAGQSHCRRHASYGTRFQAPMDSSLSSSPSSSVTAPFTEGSACSSGR